MPFPSRARRKSQSHQRRKIKTEAACAKRQELPSAPPTWQQLRFLRIKTTDGLTLITSPYSIAIASDQQVSTDGATWTNLTVSATYSVSATATLTTANASSVLNGSRYLYTAGHQHRRSH